MPRRAARRAQLQAPRSASSSAADPRLPDNHDRDLVFELGYRIHSQNVTNHAVFRVGGAGTGDLPGTSSSALLNPWFELSDAVMFR